MAMSLRNPFYTKQTLNKRLFEYFPHGTNANVVLVPTIEIDKENIKICKLKSKI